MTRSVFKDEIYFKNYIELIESIVSKAEGLIKSNIKNAIYLKRTNGDYLHYILIASYSWNKPIKELDNLYSILVDYICANWGQNLLIKVGRDQKILNELLPDIHYSILDILSIGVLLGNKSTQFKKIRNWLNELNIENKVFDTLIKYELKDHKISQNSKGPKYLEKFEAIVSPSNIEKSKLINYHKTWYGSLHQKHYGWKDNHLIRNDLFRGYWNFPIAAISKIHELDVSELYENIFFPTDLFIKNDTLFQYELTSELEFIIELDKVINTCKLYHIISSKLRSVRNSIFKEKKLKMDDLENELLKFKELVYKKFPSYRVLPWKKAKLNNLDRMLTIIKTTALSTK